MSYKDVAITSAINRALHREGISDTRVDQVRWTDTCRILGITTPTATLQGPLKNRDTVLKAAQSVSVSISDAVPQ